MISRGHMSPKATAYISNSPERKLNSKVSVDRMDIMNVERNNNKSGLIKQGVLSPMKQYKGRQSNETLPLVRDFNPESKK